MIFRHCQEQKRGQDPHIVHNLPRLIPVVAKAIELNNLPSTLVYSPFLRCRETAEDIRVILEDHFNHQVTRCIHDPDLAEYMGNKKSPQLMTRGTKALFPSWKVCHLEKPWEFRERVEKIPKKNYYNSSSWIITHSPICWILADKVCNPGKFVLANISKPLKEKDPWEYDCGEETPEMKKTRIACILLQTTEDIEKTAKWVTHMIDGFENREDAVWFLKRNYQIMSGKLN